MQIRRNACDRKGCKREDAASFHIFADRKPDGAGSMENWYKAFDLCPGCSASVLSQFFNDEPELATKVIGQHSITTRLE